jgi:RND family efflux transporter MFP subunit
MVDEPKRRKPTALIRPAVLLLTLAVIAFFVWRYYTRREDYRGGNVQTTGTIEAVQVQLGFQVGGRIAEVPVSEGDRVGVGQTVAKLDPQDFIVAVGSARAAIASARASVAQARASRDRARLELSRIRELLGKGFATAQQMDTVLAASRIAEAQVRAAEAQVRQAESALAQAELQLSYAVLRAPERGEVLERVHLPGEIVTAGTPVVTIAHTDTVKVHAPVDETRVGAVRPGDRVVVRVYTFDRRSFPGTVTDIAPAGEFATRKDWGAQRRDIRTFTVTANIPNPEHLLKDGMTAEVTIEVSRSVQSEARARR